MPQQELNVCDLETERWRSTGYEDKKTQKRTDRHAEMITYEIMNSSDVES